MKPYFVCVSVYLNCKICFARTFEEHILDFLGSYVRSPISASYAHCMYEIYCVLLSDCEFVLLVLKCWYSPLHSQNSFVEVETFLLFTKIKLFNLWKTILNNQPLPQNYLKNFIALDCAFNCSFRDNLKKLTKKMKDLAEDSVSMSIVVLPFVLF